MRDSNLAILETFVAVAEDRSFSRAAQRLGVTASAESQAVKRLEERVGAPLFARTTRSVRLTEAGDRLASRAGPARPGPLRWRWRSFRSRGRGVSGVLRLNVPRIAVLSVVMPALPAFLEDNPDASVELAVEDRLSTSWPRWASTPVSGSTSRSPTA